MADVHIVVQLLRRQQLQLLQFERRFNGEGLEEYLVISCHITVWKSANLFCASNRSRFKPSSWNLYADSGSSSLKLQNTAKYIQFVNSTFQIYFSVADNSLVVEVVTLQLSHVALKRGDVSFHNRPLRSDLENITCAKNMI